MPQKTPLFEEHERLGAAITDFHGWMLPVYYSTPVAEHNAVRSACGLFDVSHMGEILLEGKDAEKLAQKVVARDITGMKEGGMRLGVMCSEKGGIIDDLTVYKFSGEKFWAVVNAATYEKDFMAFAGNAGGLDVRVSGLRDGTAKIDLQGPAAQEILGKITGLDFEKIKFYNFAEIKLCGAGCVASRSGYTGEDGFELYFGAEKAAEIWNSLLGAGKENGLVPCGLGARDTLRLEAGMMLCGQDFDEGRTPLQCPYGRIIGWEKDFIGKKALLKQKKKPAGALLAGFEMTGRGIARNGCKIFRAEGGKQAGIVTSGSFAPTLKKSIGLGYIAAGLGRPGSEFFVEIRGSMVGAKAVELPFYRRQRK